jgi:hypothetical protein
MEFIENCRANWGNYVLQMPCSRIQSRFFVCNQMDEGLWGNPTNAGMDHNRPLGLRFRRLMVMMMRL